jgi:hypothetical protein
MNFALQNLEITIDRSYLHMQGGIDTFEVLLTPEATLQNISAVMVRSAGYYYKRFVSKQATVYNVFAKLSGANIKFSPSDLIVITDLAVASQSLADGTNLYTSKAGEKSDFRIVLRDRFGNQVDSTDNYLNNIVTVAMQHTTKATSIAFTLKFSDAQRVLEASYAPTVLGDYNITIMVNGEPMTLSSATMIVGAGPMSPPHCLYYEPLNPGSPGIYTSARAGQRKYLRVKARDQYENPINVPNQYSFEFNFSTTSLAFVSDIKNVYEGNGVYAISFMPEKAPQNITFDIVTNKVVVADATAKSMAISFGEPSILSSIIPATTAKAGVEFAIIVLCRDAKSNEITSCNDGKFFIKVSYGIQVATAGVSIATATGFSKTFTASTAGTYNIEVRLVNTTVDANAQVDVIKTVTITPADTDNTLNGKSAPPEGEGAYEPQKLTASSFVIVAKDTFGNTQAHGSDLVTATVAGSAIGVTVAYWSGGRWNVTYTAPSVSFLLAYTIGSFDGASTGAEVQVWSATVDPGDDPAVCNVNWGHSSCDAAGCVTPNPLKANMELTVQIAYLTQGATIINTAFTGSFLIKLRPIDAALPTIEFSSSNVGGTVPQQATISDIWRMGVYTVEAYKNRATLCDANPEKLIVTAGDIDAISTRIVDFPPFTCLEGCGAAEDHTFMVELRDRANQVTLLI